MESSLYQLNAVTDLSWLWPEHLLHNTTLETTGSRALESAHLDTEVMARGYRHSCPTRLSLPSVTLPAGHISQFPVWAVLVPASGKLTLK